MRNVFTPYFTRATGLGLAIAAAVILLDQLSKWLIVAVVMGDRPGVVEITPFFNIVLVYNRGVSFGQLGDIPPWLLTALALAITAGLLVWLRRADNRWVVVGLGMVIGGAIGNAIDRVFTAERAVVDFLDFHIGECASYCHWPAFNVADSGIFVGVALLLIDSLIAPRPAPKLADGDEDK